MLVLNQQAALATKWKEPPRDALDTMILITGLRLPQVCLIAVVLKHWITTTITH
jgi:hypothetical protein